MKIDTKRLGTMGSIIRILRRNGRGFVFTAGDFSGVGSRTAIDKSLSRLAKAGVIRRLGRGVYDFPRRSKSLGLVTPSTESIARAIARHEGVGLQVSGARAANALGLSTQVPARSLFLTEGTPRIRRIAGQSFEMKRAARKRFVGAGSRARTAIEALRHLGRRQATVEHVKRVVGALDSDDRDEFYALCRTAPAWLQRIIERQHSAIEDVTDRITGPTLRDEER